MFFKIFAGIVAATLLIVFVGPVLVKLESVPLTIVVLIGLTMMLVDIWHSLKSKDD